MRRGATLVLLALGCSGPPGGALYVTSGFEDRVYVLDAANGFVLDTIDLDRRFGEVDEPHGVTVSPTGDFWYATLAHGEPTLWKFETGSNRLVGRVTLPLPGASRVGIDPTGRVGLIPDYFRSGGGEPSRVAAVDLVRMEVKRTAELCAAPHDAQFDLAGGRIAVACSLGGEVLILDEENLSVRRRIPVGDGASRPMNLVWARDGSTLFVTLMGEGRVLALDPASGSPQRSGITGASPAQIAITGDGALVATANRRDRSVSLFDTETLTERRRIPVPGAHPHGVAFDDSGEALYVTYEGTIEFPGGVVAFDRAGAQIWHTPLGNFTLGVAYSPISSSAPPPD